MNIMALELDIANMPIPLWMSVMFGPGILWFIFSAFLCSFICWKFIFGNCADEVLKTDKRMSVFKTALTVFLCNFLSCVLLLIIEFIIRTTGDKYSFMLDSLTIWDSAVTVIVYAIPIVISFFVIHRQVIKRGYYMVADRTPVKIASWIMPLFCSPWYIWIPTSFIQDLSDFIQSGGNIIIE